MAWTVIREDFKGNGLSEQIEFRPSTISLFADDSFKVLKYIDPYDDTSFNGLMCKDFIADLNRLRQVQPQDEQQFDKLIELAQACADDPHSYLKFYGD